MLWSTKKKPSTHQWRVTSKIKNSCRLSILILIPKQINTIKSGFFFNLKILKTDTVQRTYYLNVGCCQQCRGICNQNRINSFRKTITKACIDTIHTAFQRPSLYSFPLNNFIQLLPDKQNTRATAKWTGYWQVSPLPNQQSPYVQFHTELEVT